MFMFKPTQSVGGTMMSQTSVLSLVAGICSGMVLSKASLAADLQQPADASQALVKMATTPEDLAKLNAQYNYKGWDIYFPTYNDTITKDFGGFRTTLADYGFGFIGYNVGIGARNLSNTPTKDSVTGAHDYFGQQTDYYNITNLQLTYDTSRIGIPGGQLQAVGTINAVSTDPDRYIPRRIALMGLSWYQQLFGGRLEIKAGFNGNYADFVGAVVGGNLANPFGTLAAIPSEVGLTGPVWDAPEFRATWHITDRWYDEAMVQRSMNLFAPMPNVIVNEQVYNPSGTAWSEPKSRTFWINEFGYKNEAAPGDPKTWFRAGVMYNNSPYFTNFETGGTSENWGAYGLYDRQISQFGSSRETAYRGVYAGGTVMYAPPQTNAFSQYYEARLYGIGLFDSRPFDQIAVTYSHQELSKYLIDLVNSFSAVTQQYGQRQSNSATIAYTAKLTDGVYTTVGFSYTDHPAPTGGASNVGSAYNVVWSTFVVF